MTRPVHLARRGGVYLVRFRLPKDLSLALGMSEIRRSLLTRDRKTAEACCLHATAWFRQEVVRLRMASNPTRGDLERAAREFFERLRAGLDQPRTFDPDNFDLDVANAVELANAQLELHQIELTENRFGFASRYSADEMLVRVGIDPGSLEPSTMQTARRLASRALRAQWQLYVHQLTNPTGQIADFDPLFEDAYQPIVPIERRGATSVSAPSGLTLGGAVSEYLAAKKPTVGKSQFDEVDRALGWLCEALGKDTPFAAITKDGLRGFRDDLTRIDVTLRGRKRPFKDRLTNVPAKQIKSQTYLRYWKSVQSLFRWCESEGLRDDDPAASLALAARKQDEVHSPEPFSEPELRKLFATPVFAGYQPPRKFHVPGSYRAKGPHWWFCVLALHSGLRAGEVSQLLPDDFDFASDVPHLKVRAEDASGAKVKQTKTKASVRDVPLHPNLIALGLPDFVAKSRKRNPKARVFEFFKLGAGDRISDGATRFWGKYLRTFGLHKPGRSTHVFRHTFAAALRNAGALDEDIGALLGHAGSTITAGYGGGQSLARKAKTLALLDYGFDVVAILQDQLDDPPLSD